MWEWGFVCLFCVVNIQNNKTCKKKKKKKITRESIGGVRNQKTGLSDSSITDDHTLDSLHCCLVVLKKTKKVFFVVIYKRCGAERTQREKKREEVPRNAFCEKNGCQKTSLFFIFFTIFCFVK